MMTIEILWLSGIAILIVRRTDGGPFPTHLNLTDVVRAVDEAANKYTGNPKAPLVTDYNIVYKYFSKDIAPMGLALRLKHIHPDLATQVTGFAAEALLAAVEPSEPA